MMENTCVNSVDKELLKQERRARNKQKRESRKLEKQKEREKLNLLYSIRPQGANVSLITPHFASYANGLHSASNLCQNEDLELTEKDFPLIGESSKTVSTDKAPDDTSYPAKINRKKINKSGMNINILDLIKSEKQKSQNHNFKSNLCINKNENHLASSHSQIKRGKHRENEVKKLSKLKSAINEDNQGENNDPGPSQILYCNNDITEDLENATKTFMTRLVNIQEKLYQKNPLKGKIKRRYVVGFHEVKKYLKLGKIKILIIATDIKVFKENDTLHNTIKELADIAKQQDTEYFFCLRRRKLGSLTKKNMPISCIGIFNYDGAQDEFKSLEDEFKKAKLSFQHQNSESVSDLIQNVICTLKEL